MPRTYGPNIYVPIEGEIEHSTEKAYYFSFHDAENRPVKIWIPKSQTQGVLFGDEETYDVIYVAEWILKNAGSSRCNMSEEARHAVDAAMKKQREE